ncbi:hypothetical protein [Actinophytocola sp.]|jgi:hypothetical protein|uniref:hypothetical protein n=1 Tax=Actinophytocola sp. TaxID=1872138 RepID=UPI002EDA59C8
MRVRTALVLGPLLVIGLAGCGGSAGDGKVATAGGPASTSNSAAAGQSDKAAALKFSQCMRDNGVPSFPDPEFGANGEVRLGTPDGVDRTKVDAAQKKCQQYLPNGGQPQPLDPDKLAQVREYAQCMRDNGVPKFPDPDPNGGIKIDSGPGLDPMSPEFKATDEKCRAKLPGGGGGGSVNSQNGDGSGGQG